jgi:Dolichyl-phosphate-mannose-protein mannosyltransferase
MLDLVFLACLTLTSLGVGGCIVKRLVSSSEHATDFLALALPVGLGVLSLSTFGLAECALLTRGALALLLAIGVILGLGSVRALIVGLSPGRSAAEQLDSRRTVFDLACDLALAATLIGTLLTALTPVTDGDALCYHLQVPKLFLWNHSVVFDPDLHETIYPLVTEMLYAVALAFRGPVACRLVQWLLGVSLALSVTAIARPLLGSRARLAGAIALLVPAISNGMGAPLNDVALAAFGNGALLAWIRWRDRPSLGAATLAGVLAGIAIGVKYPALVWVGILVVAAIGLEGFAWARCRLGERRKMEDGTQSEQERQKTEDRRQRDSETRKMEDGTQSEQERQKAEDRRQTDSERQMMEDGTHKDQERQKTEGRRQREEPESREDGERTQILTTRDSIGRRGARSGWTFRFRPLSSVCFLLSSVFARAVSVLSSLFRCTPFFNQLLAFSITALVIGGGSYLRAYAHTGNPVYPFFRHTFGGAGIDDVLDPIKRPMAVTAWNLVSALGPLSLQPNRFDSVSHQFGPAFLLFLPAFLLMRPPKRLMGVVALGWLFITVCLTQRQSMRFLLIAIGPLSIGVAWMAHKWRERCSIPARLLLGLMALMFGFEASLSLIRARHGLPVVLGRESADAFLRRREPTYEVGRWMAQNLPTSARVIGQDHRGFYLPRPYTMELAHRRRTGLGTRGESADAFVDHFRQQGFTHLLLCPPIPENVVEFDPTLSRRLEPWLAKRAPLYEKVITDGDGVARRYAIVDLSAHAQLVDAGRAQE